MTSHSIQRLFEAELYSNLPPTASGAIPSDCCGQGASLFDPHAAASAALEALSTSCCSGGEGLGCVRSGGAHSGALILAVASWARTMSSCGDEQSAQDMPASVMSSLRVSSGVGSSSLSRFFKHDESAPTCWLQTSSGSTAKLPNDALKTHCFCRKSWNCTSTSPSPSIFVIRPTSPSDNSVGSSESDCIARLTTTRQPTANCSGPLPPPCSCAPSPLLARGSSETQRLRPAGGATSERQARMSGESSSSASPGRRPSTKDVLLRLAFPVRNFVCPSIARPPKPSSASSPVCALCDSGGFCTSSDGCTSEMRGVRVAATRGALPRATRSALAVAAVPQLEVVAPLGGGSSADGRGASLLHA
mmetsp:Transcript_4150/g.11954  ORF Transcript_4150/g.11954 Transcript_4150/m.11954 type:complete len:361 (-) Transcript_4150:284-1366(-)